MSGKVRTFAPEIKKTSRMKVVILTGSARKKGCSALLAEKFMEGAREAGHEVERIDTAFRSVHGCIGCLRCAQGENPCVWKDDMPAIGKAIDEADAVVYAFPMYYHLMPSYLKAVQERFFGFEKSFNGAHKKVYMLVTAEDNSDENFAPMRTWLRSDMGWLKWDIAGEICAAPFNTRSEIEASEFPQQAYEMGRNI